MRNMLLFCAALLSAAGAFAERRVIEGRVTCEPVLITSGRGFGVGAKFRRAP